MTKQEIASKYGEEQWTMDTEFKWIRAADGRTPQNWEQQMCICGNQEWCGKVSHRPVFAVSKN